MNCSSCGAELRPKSKFCGVCGAAVTVQSVEDQSQAVLRSPKPIYCIGCGAQLQAGDLFCDRCGASQDESGKIPGLPETPGRAVPSVKLSSTSDRAARKPKLFLVGGGAVLVALLLGGTVLFMNRGSSDPSASAKPTAQAPSSGQITSYSPGQAVAEQTATPTTKIETVSVAQGTTTPQSAAASAAKVATSTVQAAASATAISKAQGTATVQARTAATATVQAQATVQAKATAQAIEAEAASLTRGATKLPTVLRGALDYREDGKISVRRWGVKLLDFMLEGRFFNPYDRNIRPWDYGITFREGDTGQFRLSLHQDTEWYLKVEDWSSGKSTYKTIAKGHVPGMAVDPDGSNVIKLICRGNDGMLFVNSVFVDRLNLSMHKESGDVAVAANFSSSSGIAGKSTRYEGFDLYELK